MDEFVAPSFGLDGSFKNIQITLLPILCFLPWKTSEYMLYDALQSYEWLILSETIFCSTQEDVDEVFL